MTAPPTPYGPAPSVKLHEVEWRIDGNEHNGRARYVPYLDARWVAAALDDWVGPQNWEDSYEPTKMLGKEAVICTIKIWFPATGDTSPDSDSYDAIPGRWVSKTDIGFNDGPAGVAVKGNYSDAFKRVGTGRWGVGRNVYDLPGDIWAQVEIRNGKAYKHPGAHLQIRAELEKRGHEILHETAEVRVQGDSVSSDTDYVEPPEMLSTEQIAEIAGVITRSLTGETLKLAKATLFEQFGKLADLRADRYDEVLRTAVAIVSEHTREPESPATPDAPPVEEPERGSASTEEPSPAPGAAEPTIGELTPEEIDQMTLKGITEHLNQFDLPITGNMATKKARLKAHIAPFTQSPDAPKAPQGPTGTMDDWLAGAELPAHPETGEALSTLENYVTGIEKYEESFEDAEAMLWNEWLSATFPDDVWPPTIQHKAYVAWTTAHHLQAHGELP